MIADINIKEKSFGPKILMTGVRFSIDDGEKVGLIGRNGIGKSTLFGILSGQDKDYSGEIIYRRGSVVVATKQEHHDVGTKSVLGYILEGLPEYSNLSHIIETYPEIMGSDIRKINEYSEALERFGSKGFYEIEEQLVRELENFQLEGVAQRPFSSLSGGEKRLVETIKVMHSGANLALIDEPTNHMDYVAKGLFVDWLKSAKEAMLVITHDRDVLDEVDRIVELKDGQSFSFKGNYRDYLRQNTVSTSSKMNEYEVTQRQIENLKKRVAYARSKKASWGGTADKRNPFVVMENKAKKEIRELEKIDKPSFWVDKESAEEMNFKSKERYSKYKSRNIRLDVHESELKSRREIASAKSLSLGYSDKILFEGVSFSLSEGEALEFRGRNGAGKTTLVKALLASQKSLASGVRATDAANGKFDSPASKEVIYSGELSLDSHVRVGIYEQEVSRGYFDLPLIGAVERLYLDKNLQINETKIRRLLSDYLFVESDLNIPVSMLSGGQKARFQLISMLADNPQLLILDEPTNHLDLPSIEELEIALGRYSGAILYISHDNYFREAIGGNYVQIG